MAHYKTEDKGELGYRVLMTDYEGNQYTIEYFQDKKQANDVERLLSMVESVWCYGGDKDNNRYIKEYCTDRAFPYDQMKQYANDHWYFLEDNYYTAYAGTDSEGVSYNTIKHK